MDQQIVESDCFDDMWIKGAMHPVFDTYEKFLEIRQTQSEPQE